MADSASHGLRPMEAGNTSYRGKAHCYCCAGDEGKLRPRVALFMGYGSRVNPGPPAAGPPLQPDLNFRLAVRGAHRNPGGWDAEEDGCTARLPVKRSGSC